MGIKVKDGGSTVVMTDEQINHLPISLRIIVRKAREIEEIACSPIASFEDFKKQRAVLRGYVRDAARIWMPLSVRDDGSVTV